MTIQWKDTTSYRRDEKDRSPRGWTYHIDNGSQITVTKGHVHYRGSWVMHFRPWYDTYELKMPADKFTAEQAQEKALILARTAVSNLYDKLCAK